MLLGAASGAALALLFTPVSGDEVRARTKERAPELWGRREELAAEARQRAQAALEKAETMPGAGIIGWVRRFLGGVIERVRDAIQEGREGAAEGSEEARRRYETMTKRRRRGS